MLKPDHLELGSLCPFVKGFGWSVSMVTYPSLPNNNSLQLCQPVSPSVSSFFLFYVTDMLSLAILG